MPPGVSVPASDESSEESGQPAPHGGTVRRYGSEMRVLVSSTPGTGHAYPMMPLANEMKRAGHEVLWATAQDGVELVSRHGFEVAVAGMNLAERRAFLEPRFPEIFQLPPRLRRGLLFSGMFARAAAPKMVIELAPIVDRFRPDVMVHEWGEQAAAPLAVSRSIPHATIAFSGALPDHAVPMAVEALEPVWSSVGLPPPSLSDLAGDVYFHPFAKSMGQAFVLDQVRGLRPTVVEEKTGEVPEWIRSFGRNRKAIYVTAGTTLIQATLAPWSNIFEALASLDVDVLTTIGPQFSFDELGPIPPNMRVERFVPQHLVLDRVALVVSHAGAGSMLAAATAAIPQLAIPTWADQWENADAIARTDAALMLEENEHDTASIHDAVLRLLSDGAFGEAATRLASEIAAMPSPAEHVATLEQVASA
jgi:UDP:flavonoid glycosyltransferase YjiC (YdhE family)